MKKTKTQIQDEIIDGLPEIAHGILELSVRAGKTRITIEQIKKEKPSSILWVTPNTKLRDEGTPKEFGVWKASTYLRRTKLVCYQSLAKIKGHFDKVIFDEIQFLTPANVAPLLNGDITYGSILGLTGTMPKIPEKLDLYKLLKLKTLKKLSTDEAVALGIISDYKITVLETKLNSTDKYIKGGSKKKPFMTTERATYTYYDKQCRIAFATRNDFMAQRFIGNRMNLIYTLPSKIEAVKKLLKTLKGRTLIFNARKSAAEALSEHVFHSDTTDVHLNAFKNEEIDILSLVNSGGVGHTFKNVDNVIIAQVNSNKTGTVHQKLGRGLLLDNDDKVANVYMFYCKDTVDQKWCERAVEDLDNDKINFYKFEEYLK